MQSGRCSAAGRLRPALAHVRMAQAQTKAAQNRRAPVCGWKPRDQPASRTMTCRWLLEASRRPARPCSFRAARLWVAVAVFRSAMICAVSVARSCVTRFGSQNTRAVCSGHKDWQHRAVGRRWTAFTSRCDTATRSTPPVEASSICRML
ncbi:MAG: hypothetical protein ACI841_002902 [Planctomycetota bacterium]|jgi:hypothetical protein